MKLTTKGHYSVKALLDLSLQQKSGPSSTKVIASRQNIPAPYLETTLDYVGGTAYVKFKHDALPLAHQVYHRANQVFLKNFEPSV